MRRIKALRAAAMILADRDFAAANGLEPLARLVAFGVGAVEPGMFGIGPVPAVRQALGRAGWTIADVEQVEINEAFAAIALAVTRDLGLAEEIVNVEGGAIAHGHPIGASGAILTTRLIHSMQRDGLKRGIVTLCIGGGQASRWRSKHWPDRPVRHLCGLPASAAISRVCFESGHRAPIDSAAEERASCWGHSPNRRF
ncbi:Thiolase [Xanthobacter versatilis]|uniref:Thiolase n=1 Tax=Xanthobacter autotrophicus (strain ATCC BAA-1158 / Py2) TaxID=78245 RepID=A7IMC6_XANP2|nr:Thiolase [Xanthobacter autotrophicus Py2]